MKFYLWSIVWKILSQILFLFPGCFATILSHDPRMTPSPRTGYAHAKTTNGPPNRWYRTSDRHHLRKKIFIAYYYDSSVWKKWGNLTCACRTYQWLGGPYVVLACAYPVRGDGVMCRSCERIVAKEPGNKNKIWERIFHTID